MSKNYIQPNPQRRELDWLTIREAVKMVNKIKKFKMKDSDIYRHALNGDISLSIYFQSPIFLRKIQTSDHKVKLKPIESSLINLLCHLDRDCFLSERNLIISARGEYISPKQRVIDTTLSGYEYVLIQRLLARSLNIPLPVTGANGINYGVSVSLFGEIFQVFEKITWTARINQQIMLLPEKLASDISNKIHLPRTRKYCQREYFPLYDLPRDACFVIRYSELEKIINMPVKNGALPPISTRISTPLSRMFWLACKHNESISSLIRQPYKLLSIFEQWASADGITDRLSGDTLKTALERGSPTSTSPSN